MARFEAIHTSRRRLLQGAGSIAAIACFPMLNFASFQVFADSPKKYSARAMKIVQQSLVIDMLAPLKIDFRPEAFADPLTAAEIAAFRSCGINAFHHSIGTGGPEVQKETLEYLAGWQGLVGRNDDLFALVDKAVDLDRAKAEGKIAVMIGVQNSEHFQTPEDVKKYFQLGQRCSQLTYNSQNFIGTGGTDRVDGGVSDFGASIIAAMNEVGMLVDVSHCGDKTTLDAIELSKSPIAIT
ncbi:MAG: membrane dipeptidase, partial [Steroidobacteraceae bacterium]